VDATFSDGGRALGSFQFDNDKFATTGNGLGNFDILTTRGSLLAGVEYLTGLFISSANATRFATSITIATSTNNLGPQLTLQHTAPLSDSGGVIQLTGGTENFMGIARTILAGELVGEVPEASQVIFLVLGLAGMAGYTFGMWRSKG